MNILSNQIAKSIIGGGEQCYGAMIADNGKGTCKWEIRCQKTDKYGSPAGREYVTDYRVGSCSVSGKPFGSI
ncbi:hypothetical protein GY514_004860 [Escherichia coli]|nr:hypothetical protein [Escherichia coli]EFI3662514.1 hypothetical protein [Escherichia coli]